MKYLLTGAATALLLAGPAFAQDTAPADAQSGDAAGGGTTSAETSSADASTVLATVNGTDITLGHVIALRSRLPQQYQQLPDEALYQGMLDQIIQQEVLRESAQSDLSRADELGLENESRAYLAGRVIERLGAEPMDDAAIQAAYDAQYGDAEAGTEFNASHILVETEEEARAIKAQLDDGADFAELAQENSTGPSGPNGGELGWFEQGMMVPEFEGAVADMEPGQVSDPIQTQFGWHVIKLNETRAKEAPTLEEVRPELEAAVRDAAIQAEVQRLMEGADIERTGADIDPALVRNDDLLEE